MGLVYVAVAGLGRRRWCGDSCGRAIGRRTSATRPGRPSRCCSSAPWTAARSVSGRPRRPAAPVSLLGAAHDGPRRGRGRRRPRAGAGAPADRGGRADPRRRAPPGPGRRRRRCWRRGPARRSTAATPAARARTRPALDAAGHQRRAAPRSGARRAATRPARRGSPSPRRSRPIDPGNAELAAARDAGDPASSRGSRSSRTRRPAGGWSAIAGTHGKSTSAGWLVHVLAVGRPGSRARSSGALLPAALTGFGVPATARRGAGDAFVVEADEYAGNFDAYRPAVIVLTSAEWDHPDVFADRAAVLAAFEAWIRRAGEPADGATPAPVLVANVGDAGSPSSSRGSADWPGRIVATALVGRGAAADRRLRPRDRGPVPQRGRARRGAPRPDHRDGPRGDDARDRGPRPARRPGPVRLPTAGRHNAANALGRGGRRGRRWASTPAPIAAGLAGFGGVGRRLERKGEAARRRGLRRLRPPPDGDPRDARRRPPARARPPRLGGLRAADLPPDGGAARRVRRGARGGRRRRDRRHLGRPRPGHDRSARRPAWPRPSRPREPAIPVEAPGQRRGDRGLARRRGPARATSCW